jgi:Na+/H+ antiporter NhaC
MRPVTDRLRISREKLAYIVDSTSAPVASLALISTWIGFEVGLIDEALKAADIDESGYGVFVSSLPYRFYPLLALVLVFLVAFSGRDLGSMRRQRGGHWLVSPRVRATSPLPPTTSSCRMPTPSTGS